MGTIGGQRPSSTKERMSASASLVRVDSRVTPPLSSTSMSAGLPEASIANPSGDGVGMCALADGRLAHLGGATLDNEENYLIKKLFTGLGAIQVENQARI